MRDPAAETWLTELAVTWEYVDVVDLAAIDQKASLRNQARLEAINDDAVDRYVDDMKAGDVFPPIIVRRKADRLIVLSGNHRQTAARKAGTPLSGYVLVDCTDETALRIAYEDNRDHGLALTDPERIRQAQHLVANGWTQAAAARVVGVTQSKLSRAMAASAFAQRCVDVGTRPPDFVETTKSRLMNLKSDPAFLAAVHLVEDADLAGDDVYRIVTAVNAQRSETAALELIRNEHAIQADRIQRRAAGTNVRGTTGRAQLLRTVTALCQLKPHDVAASTLPDQRRQLLDQLRKAMEHIAAIDTAVRKP